MTYFQHPFSLSTLLAVCVLAIAAGACNDDPTTIGSGYLTQNVVFKSYTLRPEDFEFISGISDASNSTAEAGYNLLVGKAPRGSAAYGLMAITSESPLLSGAAAKPISIATLKIHASGYRFGDTASHKASFDVVVLDQVFASNVKYSTDLASRIETAPVVLGTFIGTYTDDAAISVPLDTAKTRTFLQEYFRYDSTTVNGTVTREFHTLKSLAIRTHDSTGTIISFIGAVPSPDTLHPTLEFVVPGETVKLPIGTSSWIGTNDIALGSGKFVLSAGLPVRTLIRLKIDSIPDYAIIHQAELLIHVDSSQTVFGSSGVTRFLGGYFARDSSLQPGSFLKGVAGITADRQAVDSLRFKDVFRVTNIAPAISGWLRARKEPGNAQLRNNGIILGFNRNNTSHTNLETATIDRIGFFGSDAPDPALRPSLTIIYSLQVDAKN